MSRRRHERADDELADWLAELGEPAPDEEATAGPAAGSGGGAATGPGGRPDHPTVPPDHPTVPTPTQGLLQPPTGGHATSAAWAPDPEASADPGRGGDDPRRSSRRLWLLAALPWLVMAAVAVAAWVDVGATDAPDPEGDPAPGLATADDDSDTGSPGAAQPQDGDGEPAGKDASTGSAASGAGAGEPPSGELAATAEAAVRTVGARQLAEVDDGAVHVGYARATGASSLGDGVVVTVAALMRRATDGRWSEPDPIRFAVALDGEGRLREPPWPLPGPELSVGGSEPAALDPVDVAAADDLVDAASRALARAGYDTPDVQALHRVGGDRALRVEALARPPGARERGAVVAWLTPDAGRVLGQRAAATEGAATDGGAPEEPDP